MQRKLPKLIWILNGFLVVFLLRPTDYTQNDNLKKMDDRW